MGRIVITLEEAELLELQEILLDRDEKASLAFLQKCLGGKLPAKGTAACDSSRKNPYLLRGSDQDGSETTGNE